MIKLVPFKTDHVLAFEPRDPVDLDAMIKNAARINHEGMAFSAEADGRIVGCAGIFFMHKGVAEAWTFFGRDICRYPKFMHKMTLRVIEDAIRTRNLHRLQTDVLEDSERNRKWIRRLGFRREGRKTGFGPNGENVLTYVILRRA